MNKVLIYGGLGNQMFQYAFNISLNEKGNESQILFSNFFYDQHHNGFNLGQAFNLELPFPVNVYNFILSNGGILYKNKISRFILRRSISYFQEQKYISYHEKKQFVYDKEVFNQTSKLFVGTWQVESYFKDNVEIIKNKFKFNKPKDKKNNTLVHQIKKTNSVSIHIRRGDYVSPQWLNTHNVVKQIDYYLKAIEYLNARFENLQYFIFSDDSTWAKQNLRLKNAVFIDHNLGKNSYIDMYLMSVCKHNIIANSTFSWWGAWLNQNEDKITIMPETWLNNMECDGIFPSKWIKISAR